MTATARTQHVSTRYGSSRLTIILAGNLARPALALSLAAAAQAAVIGFNGDQGLAGWEYNQNDAGTPLQIVNNETIQFTTGAGNTRSLWHRTRQDITQFEVDFTYRANPTGLVGVTGVAFTLQNSPSGFDAVAPFPNGLGYAGITPSAAITLELHTNAGVSRSGFYTNGVISDGSALTSPVNAMNWGEIDVNIRYNGSVLTVTLNDGVNSSVPRNYLVGSLANILGGSEAYIGFTTGTLGPAEQFLSNFRYVPEPTGALALLAAIPALRRWVR